jgi:hypothetical protein
MCSDVSVVVRRARVLRRVKQQLLKLVTHRQAALGHIERRVVWVAGCWNAKRLLLTSVLGGLENRKRPHLVVCWLIYSLCLNPSFHMCVAGMRTQHCILLLLLPLQFLESSAHALLRACHSYWCGR